MSTKQATLTAEDRQVARGFGHSLADVEAFKQRQGEDEALKRPGLVRLSGLPGEVMLTAEDFAVAKALNHSVREVVEFKLRDQAAKAERQRLAIL